MGEGMMINTLTSERIDKFKEVISSRQLLTVILENVHDPHNIGAVMRSCDAVGIPEIYVIFTENTHNLLTQKIGKKSAAGSRKWVKAHYYGDLEECIHDVKKKYKRIFGTHLSEKSVSLYELNLTDPIALMFGNERDGLSDKALELIDGNFTIPQFGMVQSLNISVACAVSLFESLRQRLQKGMYDTVFDDNNSSHKQMFDEYVETHTSSIRDRRIKI